MRSRRRRIVRVVLLFVVTVAAFRVFGPALVVISGTAITPVIEPGDVILARPFRRSPPQRGDFVLIDTPFQRENRLTTLLRLLGEGIPDLPLPSLEDSSGVSALVPRLVVGVPGDTVVWTETGVSVAPADRAESPWNLTRAPLHSALVQTEQRMTLSADQYFLIALQAGYVDTTVYEPVPQQSIRYRIESIVLPPERRNVIPAGTELFSR